MTPETEERLIESLGEIKSLGREQIRLQTITNGRLLKVEGRLDELDDWRESVEKAEAQRSGFAEAQAETAISRKQLRALWALFTGTAAFAAAIGGAVVRLMG